MVNPTDPLAPEACSFCVNGAFIFVNRPLVALYKAWIRVADEAACSVSRGRHLSAFEFNDHSTTGIKELERLLVEARRFAQRLTAVA